MSIIICINFGFFTCTWQKFKTLKFLGLFRKFYLKHLIRIVILLKRTLKNGFYGTYQNGHVLDLSMGYMTDSNYLTPAIFITYYCILYNCNVIIKSHVISPVSPKWVSHAIRLQRVLYDLLVRASLQAHCTEAKSFFQEFIILYNIWLTQVSTNSL